MRESGSFERIPLLRDLWGPQGFHYGLGFRVCSFNCTRIGFPLTGTKIFDNGVSFKRPYEGLDEGTIRVCKMAPLRDL